MALVPVAARRFATAVPRSIATAVAVSFVLVARRGGLVAVLPASAAGRQRTVAVYAWAMSKDETCELRTAVHGCSNQTREPRPDGLLALGARSAREPRDMYGSAIQIFGALGFFFLTQPFVRSKSEWNT